MSEKNKVKWSCPNCGAAAHVHGKGGKEKCRVRQGACDGFICDCDSDGDEDHGRTYEKPCHEASCTHCGWFGTFPVKPKGLEAWEKRALEAGWTPPEKRRAELGMVTRKGK